MGELSWWFFTTWKVGDTHSCVSSAHLLYKELWDEIFRANCIMKEKTYMHRRKQSLLRIVNQEVTQQKPSTLKSKSIIWHTWARNFLSKKKDVSTWAKWSAQYFSSLYEKSFLLSSMAFRVLKVWEIGCYCRPPNCMSYLQCQRLQSKSKTHKNIFSI